MAAMTGGADVALGAVVAAPGADVELGAVVAAAGTVGRGVAVADDPQAANRNIPKIKPVSAMTLGLLKIECMILTPPDFETPMILAAPQCWRRIWLQLNHSIL